MTLHPLTSSPALHKQVIDMAGVPLRQGHCNEEQLPHKNKMAIESRDLSWLLHRSTPGFFEGKETGLWFTMLWFYFTSITPYPSSHTVVISFGATSFILKSPLTHLIVDSFLPNPVSFPPPI
jgi:hypothetical protein